MGTGIRNNNSLNKINKLIAVGSVAFAAGVCAAGCAPLHRDNSAGPAPIGMANPASVWCVEKRGGKLEIRKDASGGEYGVCHLPDGSTVEEWGLYRRDHGKNK